VVRLARCRTFSSPPRWCAKRLVNAQLAWIEAALPLDPAGEQAQAFVAEWDALLAPFRALSTAQMMAGAQSFWEKSDRYRGQVQLPFSPEVFFFMQGAQAAKPS